MMKDVSELRHGVSTVRDGHSENESEDKGPGTFTLIRQRSGYPSVIKLQIPLRTCFVSLDSK